MLFKPFIPLALAVATHVLAAPATEKTNDDLTIIQSLPYGNGTLVAYGSAPGAVTARSKSAPMCSSKIITCGGNRGNTNTCSALIGRLKDNPTIIRENDGSVCLNDGGTCCVSWSMFTGEARLADLFDAANAILSGCNGGPDGVGGVELGVVINGQCLNECVSESTVPCSDR